MNVIVNLLNDIALELLAPQLCPIIATCSSSTCTCCNEEEHTPNTPNIAPRICTFSV